MSTHFVLITSSCEMITPSQVVNKIEKYGSESLTDSERIFVVNIFRAAAMSARPEYAEIKHRIQKAHLEYCLNMGNK